MNTTMQSYKSFVAQVVFVVLYSVFIVVDFTIIGYDHNNSYKEGTNIRQADKLFVVIQSVLDLTIVLGYVILFVFFMKLIGEQAELHVMKRNVLVFFIFMMAVLTVQLVFNTIFYTTYDPTRSMDGHADQDDVIKQERLNSIGVYTHTAIELIFNIVILSYLISQSKSQEG